MGVTSPLREPVWFNKKIGKKVGYVMAGWMLFVPNDKTEMTKDGKDKSYHDGIYARKPVYFIEEYPCPYGYYELPKTGVNLRGVTAARWQDMREEAIRRMRSIRIDPSFAENLERKDEIMVIDMEGEAAYIDKELMGKLVEIVKNHYSHAFLWGIICGSSNKGGEGDKSYYLLYVSNCFRNWERERSWLAVKTPEVLVVDESQGELGKPSFRVLQIGIVKGKIKARKFRF